MYECFDLLQVWLACVKSWYPTVLRIRRNTWDQVHFYCTRLNLPFVTKLKWSQTNVSLQLILFFFLLFAQGLTKFCDEANLGEDFRLLFNFFWQNSNKIKEHFWLSVVSRKASTYFSTFSYFKSKFCLGRIVQKIHFKSKIQKVEKFRIMLLFQAPKIL